MSDESLVDYAARRAIREELDQTLIVEAAAGTGKTTELVGRIIAVLVSGRATLSSVVAVTFTEKAAGEMKLRIRTELDRALSPERLSDLEEKRLRQALSELETARISTIHGLCADLLREHPIDADVDPGFEVIDASRTRQLVERVFDPWLEACLSAPTEGVRRVLARRRGRTQGKSPRGELLEAVLRLVDTRDFDAPTRRDPFERTKALRDTCQALVELSRLAERSQSRSCPLVKSLKTIERKLSQVPADDDDGLEALFVDLARDRDLWNRAGQGKAFAPGLLRSEVVAERDRVKEQLERCNQRCGADLAACLQRELSRVVGLYEREKQRLGVLDFFDLLVSMGRLLSSHAVVRRSLQQRFSHLFVDEFQDTDPVQSEILLLLAADDPTEHNPWRARPVPGKLFVVGDPKQSIYRFRRADIALYERVKRILIEHGGKLVHLSTSFRALPDIQSLANAAFGAAMRGDLARGEAHYVPLAAFRAGRTTQPALVALPVPAPYGKRGGVTKTAIKASLPDAVGAWIEWLITKSDWVVREHDQDVPVGARHVCLLFRRFKDWDSDATRDYVRALEARRIPHVLSGGRSFHAREEIVALRAVLCAIEWPDDALSVYATVRGPFLAHSDESLLSARQALGHLHPCGPITLETVPSPEAEVAESLLLLRELHRGRNRKPIASTIAAFLNASRAHAGLAIWPTGEQALGNVLRVLELARSHERHAKGSSFRGFVAWFDERAEHGDAAEAKVVEESSDGVRMMTVHGAKGLEFPVVILCDPTAPKRPERGSRVIDVEKRVWAQSLCGVEPVELAEQRDSVRDQDEAEVVRLTYVAVTRAREVLVVPVVEDGPIAGWLEMLHPALHPHGSGAVAPGDHAIGDLSHQVRWWNSGLLDLTRPATGGLRQQELLVADAGQGESSVVSAHAAWLLQRTTTLTHGGLPSLRLRTVTELAADVLSKSPGSVMPEVVDSGVDRQQRPSGPRFGTLVHALLEHSARSSDEELTRLALSMARELGAPSVEVEAALHAVSVARVHPLMQAARAAYERGECEHELPISMRRDDGELVEGVIDMVFRERSDKSSRMLLVDFKTDLELGDLSVYANQLSLYAEAYALATGERPECMLFRV